MKIQDELSDWIEQIAKSEYIESYINHQESISTIEYKAQKMKQLHYPPKIYDGLEHVNIKFT